MRAFDYIVFRGGERGLNFAIDVHLRVDEANDFLDGLFRGHSEVFRCSVVGANNTVDGGG